MKNGENVVAVHTHTHTTLNKGVGVFRALKNEQTKTR